MAQLRLPSLNDVRLVGRCTRDPEVRYTSSGTPVCHFRIAVGRNYKDRTSGEWKEEVAFVACNVWREAAERCGQRMKKGSPVFVEGRLKSREWTTKEGQKRNELEVEVARIQFLESMADRSGEAAEASVSDAPADDSGFDSQDAPAPVAAGAGKAASPISEYDEEKVPF